MKFIELFEPMIDLENRVTHILSVDKEAMHDHYFKALWSIVAHCTASAAGIHGYPCSNNMTW